MNLINEAGYLYLYSKKLVRLNKKLKRLSKKAEKHSHRHGKAKSEERKLRHKLKHRKTTDEMKNLIKKHNRVLRRIKHHYLTYSHTLKKEHKA